MSRQWQPGEVLDAIHEVEKFDRLARRTYGLGEGTGSGALDIGILTGDLAVVVRPT